jgi:Skp family chaperone for outer membrane proteins
MNQPHGIRWRNALLVVGLCITAVATGAAWRAPAASPPPPPPTAIAIVNLQTLFDGLTEFKEGMATIAEKRKEAEAKLNKVTEDLKKAQTDLEALKDPPLAIRLDFAQRIAEYKSLGKTRKDTLTEVLQYTGGDIERKVFLKAIKAAEVLAKKDGWDMILLDDRHVVPPERTPGENGVEVPLTMRQVESIMQERHILVASDRVDVTPALITLMNNDYKSGKK